MKKINQIVIAIMVSMLMVISVWAEGKGKNLTLLNDITVNGTLVKQGNYVITFDKETNEMAIWKGKNKVAQAPAHIESLSQRATNTQVKVSNQNNVKVLRSVTLVGETEVIVVNETEKTAVSPQ